MAMVDTRNPFLLEEYKSLRAEIELHFRATLTIQPLVFAGLGGIIILQQYSKFAIWGVPIVILVAGLASIPHYLRMMSLGRYIYRIEGQVFSAGEGWEHYLRGDPGQAPKLPYVSSIPFFLFSVAAWVILGVSATVFATLA